MHRFNSVIEHCAQPTDQLESLDLANAFWARLGSCSKDSGVLGVGAGGRRSIGVFRVGTW